MGLLHRFRQWADLQHDIRHSLDASRTSAEIAIGQRVLVEQWKQSIRHGQIPTFREVGFRVFSQFEEDGILLFLFTLLGSERRFVDIGSSDGMFSNCANLALNHGWTGLFVDGDKEAIERGRKFYSQHPNTWAYPPTFKHAFVLRENINQIITDSGIQGEIDLLSIDIDGQDYWVWDAIECIHARVVVIETHVEFGMRDIVVPYDKDYVYPGKHPQYHGASPVAMAKLAAKKGYRLVGSNNYGFNTFYVRNDVAPELLPEVPVESVLQHPRNIQRAELFEEIKDWEYIEG